MYWTNTVLPPIYKVCPGAVSIAFDRFIFYLFLFLTQQLKGTQKRPQRFDLNNVCVTEGLPKSHCQVEVHKIELFANFIYIAMILVPFIL